MNLILFGFKSSGKTHFGKLLAKELGRKFIDTDDLIIKLYQKEVGKKKSPREIHAKIGEEEFRKIETRAIHSLKEMDNAIIALGGGTVLNPENITFLQSIGALVYLKATFATIKKRIFKDDIPSFLDKDDPEGSLYEMIKQRQPIYESISARTVDTDRLDEAGVIAALRSILYLEEPPNGF